MMNIEIIEAKKEDTAEILALQKIAYQKEAALYDDWDIPPLRQTIAEIQQEFTTSRFLKAMAGDSIVGSVRATLDSDTCKIGRLIVHPQFQGKGIGSLLMENIESRFTGARRFELFTGTKSVDNIRLYSKLGYRECHQQELSAKVRIVVMEKPTLLKG